MAHQFHSKLYNFNSKAIKRTNPLSKQQKVLLIGHHQSNQKIAMGIPIDANVVHMGIGQHGCFDFAQGDVLAMGQLDQVLLAI